MCLFSQKIIIRGLKSFSNIPGPQSLPLFGTLYKYLPVIGEYKFTELPQNGLKKYKKYGPVIREEIIPGVNIIWIFDPKDIELMFRCEGQFPQRRSHLALEKFRLDRPHIYNSGGLLPTNGSQWYRIRKAFQKGLSGPLSVKRFLKGSNNIIDEWLHERIEIIRTTNDNNNKIDYLPELSRLFLELTGYVSLDVRLNSFTKMELINKKSRTTKLINSAFTTNSCILKLDNGPQLWKKFNTPMYKQLKNAQLFMEDTAIDLLSLKISLFEEKNTNNNECTSLLEQYFSSTELDFKDIIGMVCDFFLAGIDTTTYTASFLLYHVGKSPSVQMALFEEAKKLLPNKNSPVSEQVLNDAYYTKATVKELFRLRPISVGVGRVLNETTQFSGYEVPENTVVVSQNQISCRLERYFQCPYEFKPERWLKNHPLYEKKHPYLLLPFGHGPRSCIAKHLAEQNLILLLLKFIRNYKIEWNGTTVLESKSLLINCPKDSICLKISKR